MPVGAYGVAGRLADRAGKRAVLDGPAVREEILEPAAREGDGAAGDIARDPQRAGPRLERLELAQGLAAEDLQDPGGPIHGGRRVEKLAAGRPERERDGGVRQRRARHRRGRGATLRLRGRQELTACGRLREEVFDENVRPPGTRRGPDF